MLIRLVFGVLLFAALHVAPAAAQSVVGVASVIDGDTIEIRGQRIRLFGIDAPEGRQRCERDGKPYRCGQEAALALADKIDRKTVRCEQKDLDRYGRIVAVCRLGGEDLNGWLVRNGYAVAYRRYSLDYVAAEDKARSERRGLWAGEFELPWKWRRRQ